MSQLHTSATQQFNQGKGLSPADRKLVRKLENFALGSAIAAAGASVAFAIAFPLLAAHDKTPTTMQHKVQAVKTQPL